MKRDSFSRLIFAGDPLQCNNKKQHYKQSDADSLQTDLGTT